MYWYIHTKRIYQHPYSSYLLTCNILFRPSKYFVREICFTLLIEACHHFTNRMSTTVRDIDISLDWLVSRSRTKRTDEIGFRFLANCREINVSPSRHVYIRTKTSPLVTLYVEGLFTILCSQCRAPLLRKPNMNFFFFVLPFLMDGCLGAHKHLLNSSKRISERSIVFERWNWNFCLSVRAWRVWKIRLQIVKFSSIDYFKVSFHPILLKRFVVLPLGFIAVCFRNFQNSTS